MQTPTQLAKRAPIGQSSWTDLDIKIKIPLQKFKNSSTECIKPSQRQQQQ